jgi:hypothetical protein
MGPAARGRVVGLLVLDSLVVQSALAQAGRAPVAPRAPHQLQLPAFLSAPTARHPLLPPGGCRAQGPAGPRGARPPASNRWVCVYSIAEPRGPARAHACSPARARVRPWSHHLTTCSGPQADASSVPVAWHGHE